MMILFSDEDQAALAAIRHAGGFLSDEDAIRGALWWYACFLDVECPPERFALITGAPPPRALDQPDLFGEFAP